MVYNMFSSFWGIHGFSVVMATYVIFIEKILSESKDVLLCFNVSTTNV